jgi:Dimerisation domain/O-methyltransferase domain
VITTVESSAAQDQTTPTTPDAIMQLGHAFWGSRALLSAVELDLFSELADAGALETEALCGRLGLHPRGARDFLDALVALGVLERQEGRYRNTPAAELFLDRSKPSYAGGALEIAATRLWALWGSLTDALRSGQPQNEIKTGGSLFEAIYSDPDKLRGFLRAMTGVSAGAARALASAFPWAHYGTVIDVGGAEGCVPVQLALAHEHLRGGVFELPEVGPFIEEFVARAGLSDRLRFYPATSSSTSCRARTS